MRKTRKDTTKGMKRDDVYCLRPGFRVTSSNGFLMHGSNGTYGSPCMSACMWLAFHPTCVPVPLMAIQAPWAAADEVPIPTLALLAHGLHLWWAINKGLKSAICYRVYCHAMFAGTGNVPLPSPTIARNPVLLPNLQWHAKALTPKEDKIEVQSGRGGELHQNARNERRIGDKYR